VANIKPLDTSEIERIKQQFSPFIKEVRKKIVTTALVFAVATIAGFIFYEKIIKFLISMFSLEGVNIVFTSPFQFINLAISTGVATGLVVASPVLAIQFLHFLKPALKRKEFKSATKFLPFSSLLFLFGFIFGIVVMKWQIEIFLARSIALGIGNILDISGLLVTVILTAALLGIGFQFPMILLILLRFGILKHQQLSKKRFWVYLGSFLFAILLPPDSILVDVLLSLPLIFLFELTLIINRFMVKKPLLRRKKT
jgi:sec-independent protein translocase protein TatC